MNYILGQYNQQEIDAGGDTSAYMTLISEGEATRLKRAFDDGVVGDSTTIAFYDEAVRVSLIEKTTYYLHAKIKRLTENQKFFIYLVNYDNDIIDNKTQYLKTIEVQGGEESEWTDFEMIFTPLINFNYILFQLQRRVEDYTIEKRYPRIVYEELSQVNNIIPAKINSNASLIKMGVQSHPGLMMCVNGEEIHVGRSGIYEVRNGIVSVNSFSVIQAAQEAEADDNYLEKILEEITNESNNIENDSTNSRCLFNSSKKRGMDAFVLDYMYKNKEG